MVNPDICVLNKELCSLLLFLDPLSPLPVRPQTHKLLLSDADLDLVGEGHVDIGLWTEKMLRMHVLFVNRLLAVIHKVAHVVELEVRVEILPYFQHVFDLSDSRNMTKGKSLIVRVVESVNRAERMLRNVPDIDCYKLVV